MRAVASLFRHPIVDQSAIVPITVRFREQARMARRLQPNVGWAGRAFRVFNS
jgi:hypothetical protein